MRWGRAITAAVAVGVASIGCADLFGFKELREGDAGKDVEQPDVSNDVTTCTHASVPTSPATNDGTDASDYTFAIQHVYFTSTPDGGVATPGYDIDNHCTTDPASSSCIVPTGNTVITDEANGVDNETVSLLNALIQAQPSVASALSDPSINGAIANGDFTVLFRLYGYKGGANQTASTGLLFAFQSSPGVTTAPPAFDGGDRWFAASQDVSGGLEAGTNFPTQLTSTVYVANHVVVASYPGVAVLRFQLPTGSTLSGVLVVKLSHPVLTATLVPRADGQWDLQNGTISGRWAVTDALETIASLTLSGQSLCTFFNGQVYGPVSTQVCGGRDINTAGNDDGNHACDGLSVALSFDAVAAQVTNKPKDFPESTTPCPDAGGCAN